MTAESDFEKLAERRHAMENAIATMDEEKKRFLAELAQGSLVDHATGRLPVDLANILEHHGIRVMKNESKGQENIRALLPTDWKNSYEILRSEGLYDDETEDSDHGLDPGRAS